MKSVTRDQVQKLIGKQVYAIRKDGSLASGKLVRILGNELVLEQPKGKKAQTRAIIPLVLFDLLAIGTTPFGFGGFGGYGGGFGGGYGGGFGGYGGGIGGYGGGFGGGFGGWW